jgi:flagellin-like hook-associated protein FlgL
MKRGNYMFYVEHYTPPTVNPEDYVDVDTEVTQIENNIEIINSTISDLNNNVNNNQSAIGVLDDQVTTIDGQVSTIGGQVSTIDGQVTSIDGRVTQNTTGLSDVDEKTKYFYSTPDGAFILDENGNAIDLHANKFKRKQ